MDYSEQNRNAKSLAEAVCDVCGGPVTSAAIDVREVTKETDTWRTYRPFGERKCGCASHPAISCLYGQGGTVRPV